MKKYTEAQRVEAISRMKRSAKIAGEMAPISPLSLAERYKRCDKALKRVFNDHNYTPRGMSKDQREEICHYLGKYYSLLGRYETHEDISKDMGVPVWKLERWSKEDVESAVINDLPPVHGAVARFLAMRLVSNPAHCFYY